MRVLGKCDACGKYSSATIDTGKGFLIPTDTWDSRIAIEGKLQHECPSCNKKLTCGVLFIKDLFRERDGKRIGIWSFFRIPQFSRTSGSVTTLDAVRKYIDNEIQNFDKTYKYTCPNKNLKKLMKT